MMRSSKVKLALFALATTFFAVGVTEFISVGVLPAIAQEFQISTSTAGLITTMYALGVALGAPVLTLVTSGFEQKKVILGALLAFVLGHVLISFAPIFSLVLAGRFIAGAAHGLLFALSALIAASLVGKAKQAWAIALIFSGFTVATAFGAPLGTLLSDFMSWRISFFIIAILGTVALFLNAVVLPSNSNNSKIKITEQLSIFTKPHILLVLLVTILGYGGTFATFTYLSPILAQTTHVPTQYISLVLVIYGIAIAIGNSLGGKLGDVAPLKVLLTIFSLQALALFSFYFTAKSLWLALLNIVILGLLAFMSVPILQSYILILAQTYAPKATAIASAKYFSF
ncbi:MFS transporter [Ligilactobacillus apodemi]|uniref:MFS transporter n=1 Tax=Ligilactobacillus apodemi TaxID=307126 RepID=UPI000A6C9003|nr:MFS transporter [Ligilactobacillus apodemi]